MRKNKRYGLKEGHFFPRNKEKYIGKQPIYYRSSYELEAMRWLDLSPSCIQWASETSIVPYYDPVKKKNRRYFIDLTAIFIDESGNKQKYFIEIKPYKETIPPKESPRKKKITYIQEATTYITNTAKWKAAETWCKQRGGSFIIITEKVLFKK